MSRIAMLYQAAHRRRAPRDERWRVAEADGERRREAEHERHRAAERELRRETERLRSRLELAELFIPVEARDAYRIAAAQVRDEEDG